MFNNAQLQKKHPILESIYSTTAHSKVLDISNLRLLTMLLKKLG
jgi:hypothetical protein